MHPRVCFHAPVSDVFCVCVSICCFVGGGGDLRQIWALGWVGSGGSGELICDLWLLCGVWASVQKL